MNKKSWIEGKTFIITGGTSGIGLAISKKLLAAGARIIALTYDIKEITEVTMALEAYKNNFIAMECDVTSEQSRLNFKNWLASQSHDLVGLINCAGITTFGKFFDLDSQSIQQVIRTNFEGTVLFTREIFPLILENRQTFPKYLVFLSSITAEIPSPYFGPYSGTKAGLDMFARTLKLELPKEVKVLISRPTAVDTPFYEHALTTERADIKGVKKESKRFFITPETVANSLVSAILKKKEGVIYPGFKTKLQKRLFKLPLLGSLIVKRSQKTLKEKAG